ncbi:calcium/sodium antiporter [Celeribacter sp.]|uniref:calcium/sodium antiporter n=1 Tax=Celeribacter sp. TaxID=1890673 RepID=UPI003A944EC5
MDFLIALGGLVILLIAGDTLVRGAVNLSLRLGVPALIVSLTIVALGTSAPELLISISAIYDGVPDLALGNVVGSNTANILLVLGIPAIISTLRVTDDSSRVSYLQMIGATLLFIVLAFVGPFTWVSGLILLGALTAMLLHAAYSARCHRNEAIAAAACCEEELEGADPHMSWFRIMTFLLVGLIGLPLGAELLVRASVNIARAFDVSETVIGLTLVALGTSLPELATTVMAALRRETDVALGNVIGSNMFNLLGIIGVASLFGDIPVDPSVRSFDIWVMLGASLVLGAFVLRKADITRTWGIVLSALYVVYIAWVIV